MRAPRLDVAEREAFLVQLVEERAAGVVFF
jgi:hypothetical protein